MRVLARDARGSGRTGKTERFVNLGGHAGKHASRAAPLPRTLHQLRKHATHATGRALGRHRRRGGSLGEVGGARARAGPHARAEGVERDLVQRVAGGGELRVLARDRAEPVGVLEQLAQRLAHDGAQLRGQHLRGERGARERGSERGELCLGRARGGHLLLVRQHAECDGEAGRVKQVGRANELRDELRRDGRHLGAECAVPLGKCVRAPQLAGELLRLVADSRGRVVEEWVVVAGGRCEHRHRGG
mmetsp:Transcript_25971/g.65919  ORF Transcript_25971/g.65919 Transcript_25971/m.65919 type:complete len:246 (-) Transcript_25971:64-801(-)